VTVDRLLARLNGGILIIKDGLGKQLSASALRIQSADHASIFGDEEVDFVVFTRTQRAEFEILEMSPQWRFPVGSDKFPIEKWYIASRHLDRHSRWGGGVHTGIDYNVEVYPRGDIDRGEPVFAITDGVIYATGYSQTYLGSIVIEIKHDGSPLWVRYWHLMNDNLFKSWRPGIKFPDGERLGHIGSYKSGGDHLHWDMCKEAFHPLTWWSRMSGSSNEEKLARWVDPVDVLKAHLPPDIVDASLRIGG
jgi:murein DD-endopeptidase MepM/ murein hydrolase activator NlpD